MLDNLFMCMVFENIDMLEAAKLANVKELYSLFLEESDTYESGAWEFRDTYVCIDMIYIHLS